MTDTADQQSHLPPGRSASRFLLPAVTICGTALLAGSLPAAALDTWTADPFEARVTLPDPEPGSPVTSASMSCAAQAWTLFLATGSETSAIDGTARISVPLGTYETSAKGIPAGIEVAVPPQAIEPLMRSTRLAIALPGDNGEVRFTLAGSRRAITAAQARCTQVEMPVANSVPLTPYSSYLRLTRELRRSDIADFELSTTAQPRLRAGMVELEEGRRLLFSEMCGSSWYYGGSGCNITGYAPVDGKDADEAEGWRIVYDTEGAYLYVDPDVAHDGWPDLLAYPAPAPSQAMRWTWDDGTYRLADDDMETAGMQPDEPDAD